MEKLLFSWSGGKDSALSLYKLQKNGSAKVVSLLTTISKDFNRISMHGVRKELLEKQASSIGLPVEEIFLEKSNTNEIYEAEMRKVLEKYKQNGIDSVAFGDIFLEDLKRYREENLAKIGLKGIFPIWKKDTTKLAKEFINLGFKAIITCIDSKALGKEFTGRLFDEKFLAELPKSVDPCGENGEYHTFVFDGPIFSKPISFKKGKIVFKENRFYFQDLLPSKEKGNKKNIITEYMQKSTNKFTLIPCKLFLWVSFLMAALKLKMVT